MGGRAINQKDEESLAIDLVLETLHRRCGHDFRNYSRGSIRRRLESFVATAQLQHIADLVPRMLRDESFLNALLQALSITVTRLFRNPQAYLALRERVIPALFRQVVLKFEHDHGGLAKLFRILVGEGASGHH